MNIDILLERLLLYYEVNTLTALAEKLNTTQSTISGWKAREAIGALTEKVNEGDPNALEYIFKPSSLQSNHIEAETINGDGVNNSVNSPKHYSQNTELSCEKITQNFMQILCEKYKDNQKDLQKILFDIIQKDLSS